MSFTTPVVFLIYNRADLTDKVFATIRQIQPTKLFIIADGPKNRFDAEDVGATRGIVEHCDWDVEVLRNTAEANLGCRQRTITGLDWVFQQVDRAIIVEDDVLPTPSFYRYCEELLERYKDSEEIRGISGCNLGLTFPTHDSYVFSRWASSWGWATWARAWQQRRDRVTAWEVEYDKVVSPANRPFWSKVFQANNVGQFDWSVDWLRDGWATGGLTIFPAKNLVTNLGYGSQTTTTWNSSSPFGHLKSGGLKFPLHHPTNYEPLYDNRIEAVMTDVHADAIDN